MNTNYKSNIAAGWHRQILSAVCLSAFLLITTAFAQTPTIRANGKIAFTSNRDGNREIYVMNPDGTNQTRLTNNNIIDDHPTFSPDGRKIAFLSQNASGAFAIFVMNSNGIGKTQITPVNYQSPSNWYGIDGWKMSWSPDGARIVFSEGSTLVIVSADGSNRRNLTTGFYPAWSPDGSKILFLRSVSNPFFNLLTIRPDGTDLRNIPLTFPFNYQLWDSPPIWSPDGQKIAYSSSDGANSQLDIANADGSNPQGFLEICFDFAPDGCGARTALPTWSPNGRTIAFAAVSNQSGTDIFAKNVSGGAVATLTNTSGVNTNPDWQPLTKTMPDFDGDGRADISVFRPSDGTWYLNQSTAGVSATQFGLSTDKITPADYDGDGKTDVAVFREGVWYLQRSSLGFTGIAFGEANDIPMPADYDGDGRADIAVFRPSNGVWYLQRSQLGFAGIAFGQNGDKPVAADYDGDGKADVAVFRPSNGVWYLQRSQLGFTGIAFGEAADKPVAADYDGDGKDDIAVFRPANGVWYLQQSTAGFTGIAFGFGTDLPVPADYDGDGKADIAVFRDGIWYLQRSAAGFTGVSFGASADKPVPAAYLP
jgi:Tol biopolymer transport system component